MNAFIVLSCLLVSASASPYGYYYNNQYPQYQKQVYQPSYKPLYKTAQAAAPVAPVAATGFDLESLVNLANQATTGFNLDSLTNLIPMGSTNLAKASASLNNLMKGLPAALANMDPAMKADIGKVNWLIADVCNKIVAEARPADATFSYYSTTGLSAACERINTVTQEVARIFEDPSVTQTYVDKLQKMTGALQAQADVYSQ